MKRSVIVDGVVEILHLLRYCALHMKFFEVGVYALVL